MIKAGETRSRLQRPWRAASALLTLMVVVVGASTANAQSNQYQFSTRNLKKMAKVYELLQLEGTPEEQAAATIEAREILDGINLKRARPYGRARIHQTIGSLDISEEKFPEALAHFEACIAEEALQPEEQLKTLFMVGQLQTMMERYDDAIVTLEKWISQVESPAPASYYTLAVTYYQAGRPEDALTPARQAVDLSTDTPREPWYRLLLSLYLERQNYDEALKLLDDIILAYPKKVYWTQLAAIYSQTDDLKRSLAVQQLAQGEGFVDDSRGLTRLAQMYMVEGLPHRGAEIMEKGLADGTIEPTKQAYQTYSDTLLQAREWKAAAEPLAEAAALDDDGALYVRLAQVNLQIGDWAAARRALDKAFDKGGLADEGQAHVLYGIAAFNDREWKIAERAFTRAGRFDGTSETAGKWRSYLDREKARLGVE